MHQRRERVDVGALQLRQAAVLQKKPWKGMQFGQFLEHLGVGRAAGLGLLARRQLERVEEDAGELRRRADVEGRSR